MNSYSDYDSDGYSSNEDADYVPSDDNLSEDDINECEKEDPLHKDDNVPHPDDGSRTKSKKKLISMRKRKKGVLKLKQEEMDGCGAEETVLPQEEVVKPSEVKEVDDERQKKKSDDLWASFLSDVGTRPKESTAAPQSSIIQKADSSASKAAPLTTETKAAEPATVTITKVFDFAGEEVRVNKEVSADSKEAKIYLKSLNTEQEEDGEEEKSSSPSQPTLPGTSAKRPAGVSSILSRFGGKKQKMSTLEKSKMDWDAFKSEEGITEELAIHNRGKEGFVERKNFLERVDHRQFELEKAVRLTNMKN
ncbi:putative craniofacial development protein 1 [Scophthalmus maximus]|uniref:Craniofacial development protein 1 n=1 Tax=Scophthalmus maximus TaxID=52904 RepID=A0A2U9BV41_SCOMX|nr:putative craniofacial development protein 1 [Scophthalmus maximus]